MKILVAPDTVQVTSTLGRSTAQARASGRPPCFKQIWLDCSDLSIYLVFTSGEIYRYDPNSIDVGRALIAAANHGLTFNQIYRLFGISGQAGAYERVSAIPGTAVLQYQNPPYAGTDPGACVTSPFDALIWTQASSGPPPGVWMLTPPTGGSGRTCSGNLQLPQITGVFNATTTGTMLYTGAANTYQISVHWLSTNNGASGVGIDVSIKQGATFIYEEELITTGTFITTDPFNLANGVGVDQDIQVQLELSATPVSGGNGTVGGTCTLF